MVTHRSHSRSLPLLHPSPLLSLLLLLWDPAALWVPVGAEDPRCLGICKNGGLGNSFSPVSGCYCTCPEPPAGPLAPRWAGPTCELWEVWCDPTGVSRCFNEGTCKTAYLPNNAISYSCTCPQPWTGSMCNIRGTPCGTTATCLSTQQCALLPGGWQTGFAPIPTCICNNGTGADCSEPVSSGSTQSASPASSDSGGGPNVAGIVFGVLAAVVVVGVLAGVAVYLYNKYYDQLPPLGNSLAFRPTQLAKQGSQLTLTRAPEVPNDAAIRV